MKIETEKEAVESLGRMFDVAPEILRHIFHTIPYGEKHTTSDGREFYFKKFVEPRLNEETGKWEFGFDARFDDGGSPDHLEFFVKNTGGGGPV